MLTDRLKSVLEEVKKGNNLGEEILVVGKIHYLPRGAKHNP